jgi:hypothetical protein
MFQLFHPNVACFHMDVAYVAIAIHVCCKCMFQMFHLFQDVCCKCFYLYVASLQWLYTYIANVCFNYFTLFQYVATCAIPPRALTRGQSRAAQGVPTPPGVIPHGGACSQYNTCACALCSLPLSRIGARTLCSISH